MGALSGLERLLQSQRGDLFPWVPVLFGCGILGFFSLKHDPTQTELCLIAASAALACVVLAIRRGHGLSAFAAMAVFVGVAGFGAAQLRASLVAAPVLEFRLYGAVEGRVVGTDRSVRDRLRVTLDQLRIDRLAPQDTPARVRISLADGVSAPAIGARVMTTAHLMPPQGPVEPRGFDFRRHAWFQKLGAVGYTRVPVLLVEEPGGDLAIARMRAALSGAIRSRMAPETAGFAAAITTGERADIPQAELDALRASNLAHLLAISGLHMGLLAGVVFGGIRLGFALMPPVAMRLPVKKLAALVALAAAASYLLISGGQVACTRAFVMVAVMLCAVVLDRRALSLRAVALAALLILALRPESLLDPGFQMSFAATTALIAVFSALQAWQLPPSLWWARGAVGVVLSSVVAGIATAPFAAAHFNQLSQFGLLANVLAVPVMGLLVVPSAVLALCLAPIGGGWIGLWGMDLGIRWILWVAGWVAGMDGAVRPVVMPPPSVLGLIAFGGIMLAVWRGSFRWSGTIAICAGLLIWSQASRPVVLISPEGGLVGVRTEQGRALSRSRGQGFAASRWAENDGTLLTQEEAAALWPDPAVLPDWGYSLKGRHAVLALPDGVWLIHVMGKAAHAAPIPCVPDIIVVSDRADKLPLTGGCRVMDAVTLRKTGSLALLADGRWLTAREVAGDRAWTLRDQGE